MIKIINENKREIERCTRKGFVPKTDEEKLFKVILFAKSLSNKYSNMYAQRLGNKVIEEFDSAALLGVSKAIKTYSDNKDATFITYASKCIENEIFMLTRKISRDEEKIVKKSLDEQIDKGEKKIVFRDAMIDERIERAKELEEKNERVDYEINKVFESVYHTQPYHIQRAVMYYLMGLSQKEIGEIVGVTQSYLSRVFRRKLLDSKIGKKKNQKIEFEMYLEKNKAILYISDRLKTEVTKKFKDAKYIGMNNNKNVYEIKRTEKIYNQAQEVLIKLQEEDKENIKRRQKRNTDL